MSEELGSNESLYKGIGEIYRLDGPNLPIILYEGPVRVTNNNFDQKGAGKIYYSWHPFQAINLDFETNELYLGTFAGNMNIYLEKDGTQLKGELSYVARMPSEEQLKSKYFGNVYPITVTDEPNASTDTSNIQHLEFLGVNLPEVHFFNETTKFFEEGVPIIFDKWQIVVDKRDDWDDNIKELRKSSGYGVTHTCSIQKTDGSMVSFNEVDSIVQQLGLYLSYLRGEWSSALLSTGFGSDGRAVVKNWAIRGNITPWKNSLIQSSSLNLGTKEAGLISFLKLCNDPAWSHPIMSALRWYIECNAKSSGVEGSIIIQMAAFELLNWMIVKNPETKRYTNTKFDSKDLKIKIEELLDWMGANKNINEILYPELYIFAKREDNNQHNPSKPLLTQNAPTLLKKIRDAYIHPEKSKQEFLSRMSPTAINEAYKLGQTYLKGILQKLFGYHPNILNPIRTLK